LGASSTVSSMSALNLLFVRTVSPSQ